VRKLSTDLWGGPTNVEDDDVPAPSWQQANKTVTLFVGGQDGPFPDNTVVNVTLALRAAKAFAETGQPDPSCKWS
jgi:hypothetical protein